ncbi:PREDICTED: protein spire homolog 1-like [Phaethon lepturus]|uniref:protein spire homolog 1-like n=1 Tax=Phaethon lepturus TaxID=97097 RepID=UPI00053056DF|nr:PREDICTED: protein spire homolog 1-like [Phaethon lepturus]
MESPQCEQRITKVSLAEVLRCFGHPITEEQAWAICFQCCRKMEQLAQGMYPPLHSVFLKGPGSIFIHADGTASFKVYHKSDVGSIQQSEDKLLEYLGVVIYEALDWGIDSQVERELSDPLEKLLCLMLKLDDEAMKPAVTLQDVIKSLRKMHVEDLVENPLKKKEKHWAETANRLLQKLKYEIAFPLSSSFVCGPFNPWFLKVQRILTASLWPNIICELQNGVRLRKATERPQRHTPPKECIRSPYELLLDDIQNKRYTLRKVGERKLKEWVPWESSWHEQLMAEIQRPQKLQSSAARENGSGPKGINIALKSPSNSFLSLQDDSTEFEIVNSTTQQLGPGVQETTPKLPSSTWLASARSSVVSCNGTGLTANSTCPPMSASILANIKLNGFLNAGQQQLPPYRRRSGSLERGLQSKELDCPFPTKWPSPTIAELIGTRYAMIVLEGQGLFQGGSDGVFPRAKICFSCHKQMFLKWPYSCYLCSSVICCDCCIKMSMPFRTCVHLPLHFLKFLRLSREEDPATQEQKKSELLHAVEHWECFGVPIILEPHCLAQPLWSYTGTMANWLTVDICTHCEQYLLNMASSEQQSIHLRRISWP